MNLIAIPWYVFFGGLALAVAACVYAFYRLGLHAARTRRASHARATTSSFAALPGDHLSDVRTESVAHTSDYVILGAAGHDLADPHNAADLYDNPAGRMGD